jgi:hypothetical protein
MLKRAKGELLYLINKLRCVVSLFSVMILWKKENMVIFDVGQFNETSIKQI